MPVSRKITIAVASSALLVAAGGAALWLSIPGHAIAAGSPMFAKQFEAADKDGDGSVSRAELDQHRQDLFQRFDTNNDGLASQDELVAGLMRERFRQIDADGDGTLSETEFVAMAANRSKHHNRRMKRLDADGDGMLNGTEIEAATDKFFAKLDSDDNGLIDREEMEKARKHWSKRHHRHHDGE